MGADEAHAWIKISEIRSSRILTRTVLSCKETKKTDSKLIHSESFLVIISKRADLKVGYINKKRLKSKQRNVRMFQQDSILHLYLQRTGSGLVLQRLLRNSVLSKLIRG